MRSLLRSIHRFLLPDNPEIGWTPYLWLTYFVFFYSPYFFELPSASHLAVVVPGGVVFLVLYFLGYRSRGWGFLACIAGITLIGLLMSALNPLGATFFIYACAFAAQLEGRRLVLLSVVLICASACIEWWLLSMPGWFLIPVLVFGPMVAAINLHYAERSRKQRELKLSHDEVRRLAAIAERERIARDLHDLLGHSLSLITLKAELAGKLMTRDAEAAAAELGDLERISRQALKEVRRAVTGFRALDLAGELANARLALEAGGIHFHHRGELAELPGDLDHVLAMCLRESVTNVLRHSGASRCRIRFHRGQDSVGLTIEDNGRGGVTSSGSGIRGMRERIEAVDGRLELTEEHGLRVQVTLPLSPRVEGQRAERAA